VTEWGILLARNQRGGGRSHGRGGHHLTCGGGGGGGGPSERGSVGPFPPYEGEKSVTLAESVTKKCRESKMLDNAPNFGALQRGQVGAGGALSVPREGDGKSGPLGRVQKPGAKVGPHGFRGEGGAGPEGRRGGVENPDHWPPVTDHDLLDGSGCARGEARSPLHLAQGSRTVRGDQKGLGHVIR